MGIHLSLAIADDIGRKNGGQRAIGSAQVYGSLLGCVYRAGDVALGSMLFKKLPLLRAVAP